MQAIIAMEELPTPKPSHRDAKRRFHYLRFSIRGMLIFTTYVAVLCAIGSVWPSSGQIIGPVVFLLSIAATVAFAFLRRRPWAAVMLRLSLVSLVLVSLLYLSFGPASWAYARYLTPKTEYNTIDKFASETYSYIYMPVGTTAIFSPEPIRSWSMAYMAWWMPSGTKFYDWGRGIGWHAKPITHTIVYH